MNSVLRIPLKTSPEQWARLQALQATFARVCNALAPTVQRTRVWNRVALHHMTYKALREQFPDMGSQMVCNAIYAVSRTSRLVYQHPASPFNVAKLGDRPLPLLNFKDSCPVYFDRHTLSLKNSVLSLYTLDGRMRFELTLRPEDEAALLQKKLREIVLMRHEDGLYHLSFCLADESEPVAAAPAASHLLSARISGAIPDYVRVEETA